MECFTESTLIAFLFLSISRAKTNSMKDCEHSFLLKEVSSGLENTDSRARYLLFPATGQNL